MSKQILLYPAEALLDQLLRQSHSPTASASTLPARAAIEVIPAILLDLANEGKTSGTCRFLENPDRTCSGTRKYGRIHSRSRKGSKQQGVVPPVQ